MKGVEIMPQPCLKLILKKEREREGEREKEGFHIFQYCSIFKDTAHGIQYKREGVREVFFLKFFEGEAFPEYRD